MERPKIQTKLNSSTDFGFIQNKTNRCMIQTKYKSEEICELDEASSPLPPMEEGKEEEIFTDVDASYNKSELVKNCPICLCLMTEPCRFYKITCDHRICKGCLEDMYEEAGKRVFTLGDVYRSMSVKCPFCREYSIVNLSEDKDYIKIDREYQTLLLNAFEDEFRAVGNGESALQVHEDEYRQSALKYNSTSITITFEIGIREIINRATKSVQWQEFVRIKNKRYQKIIDKIIYQVDFCINETNLKGVKNPISVKINDQFFRTEKRRQIKEKQPVEIAMQPIGGGRSFGTEMPDFLPVKLYFQKINGLNAKVREFVHDNLKTGENPLMEFIVTADRK